jgi:hypothetical protein
MNFLAQNEQTPQPSPATPTVRPRLDAVRLQVPLTDHWRPGLVPIRATMTAAGAPLSIEYAHALYTLEDWCTFYIEAAQNHPSQAERSPPDVVGATIHDWPRLYYDTVTDWWVFLTESDVHRQTE